MDPTACSPMWSSPTRLVEVRLSKLLEDSGGITVVTDGLKSGERVVTSNQYRLQPGAKVRRWPRPLPAPMGSPAHRRMPTPEAPKARMALRRLFPSPSSGGRLRPRCSWAAYS